MRVLLFAIVLAACGTSNDNGERTCTGGTGCGEGCQEANEVGVGMACTPGGGECGRNMAPFLFCTSDYEEGAWSYCTGPCDTDADCGTDAFCSGSGHGGKGCVPAICGGHAGG